jgi:electron transport complex protein RnfD
MADDSTTPRPLQVAASPHLSNSAFTTRRMMIDVIIGLAPVMIMAIVVFGWYAVAQVGMCVLACLAAEAAFTAWRGRPVVIGDFSAAVTGVILGLSLPWSAPWYVAVVASIVAIGVGKVIFGGLGQNLFNPAMVGRAFVMISFSAALSGAAYVDTDSALSVVTQATPLSAAKEAAGAVELPALLPLFIGNINGSLGETSAIACLIGGLYLCVRRSSSWEIPAGSVIGLVAVAGIGQLLGNQVTVAHHLLGGAFLFAAFFIATDPVSSPLTPRGKWVFGLVFGVLVMLIRALSNYPEGVVFAILLANALVPLINRWTVPRPVGGPVPAPAPKPAK